MNKVNLIDFEFDNCLLDNVKLFDEVLAECDELPLLKNEKFAPFLDFSISSRDLVVEIKTSKPNTLPVTIWFEGGCLRIDIDRMSETFDWSKKQIEETREKVTEIIRCLFTGYTSIETRGASRFIQMFDADGFFVNSFSYNNLFHMITGLYLFRYKNYRRIFLPIFSRTK